jgi:hypothetical protein
MLRQVHGTLGVLLELGVWTEQLDNAVRAAYQALFGCEPSHEWAGVLERHLEAYAIHKESDRMDARDRNQLPVGLRMPLESPEDVAKTIKAALEPLVPPELTVEAITEMLRLVRLGGPGRGRSRTAQRLVGQFRRDSLATLTR